jgi:cell division septation protein DedD
MRNNETGEYELVVGNKQLLSGFFIVVVLCAVAFAMGYVVGQNSPRTAKLAADQTPASGSAQDARPQPASPALPSANPPTPQPAASAPPANADASAAGAGTGAGPAAVPPPPQPTTQPAHDGGPPAPVPAPAAVSPAEAPPGTCWQVLSTRNEESARDLVQTLKDKGFPAAFGPGPNGLTRVLVGPYTDTAAMARAKTALEKAGFQPIRK